MGRAAARTSGRTPAMAEELTLAQQELRRPGDGAQKGESLCSLKTVVQGASFMMLNPEGKPYTRRDVTGSHYFMWSTIAG